MIAQELLRRTEAPPIPKAKAWAAAYGGSHGPLIDFSQAVPGYPPHPELLTRMGEAAASAEAAAYGPILGDAELRAAYAENVSALYRASIRTEQVAITAGCNEAFFVALLALAQAGDAVMLPTPWYFNHKMALDMLGVETVPLPCRAEYGFVPDAAEAERLIGDRLRAIVLVTPNNPTGAVYPPKTIAAFTELCARRGVALILDETYRDFLPDDSPPHNGFADPGWARTIVQLYSFSKSYCIPGHRAGAMIAGEVLIEEIAKVLDTLQICAPRVPQMALAWAIPALAKWRAANRDEIARRSAAFRQAVAALDGWRLGSIGAYFAYVAHPFAARDEEVCAGLARDSGVLCLPGSFFGPGQEGFLRVAFANVDAEAIGEVPVRLGKTDLARGDPETKKADP